MARFIGVDKRTARAGMESLGIKPIQRPREDSTGANCPLYVTVEGAVRLLDALLPRKIHLAAYRRAREGIRKEANLVATSGPLVRYTDREPT